MAHGINNNLSLIMKNKLSSSVLVYWLCNGLVGSVIIGVVLWFILGSGQISSTVNGQQVSTNIGSMGPLLAVGIPIALLVLIALYRILYYSTFSYTVNEGQISVTSGVLFSSTKTTDFRMVQDIQSKRGPVLMIFGLRSLQGFTSSPDQIKVSGGSFRLGGNLGYQARTTYHPDISILLPTTVAEQLRSQIATSAETPNVHVV